MKISIGFSYNNSSIVSHIIKLFLSSHFSHVYIKFHHFNERNLIFQASQLSVNLQNEVNFLKHNTVVKEFTFDVDDTLGLYMISSAFNKLGQGYSLMQLLGFIPVYLLSSIGIKIKNPFSDGRSNYICSELVGEFMNDYLNASFEDLDLITPKDIYAYLQNKEG